jgi:hypothetical protein
MIIVELPEGIVTRTTTAGKEMSGTVTFMGGSFYVPNLDIKYSDGKFSDIRLEASYNQRFGIQTSRILELKGGQKG